MLKVTTYFNVSGTLPGEVADTFILNYYGRSWRDVQKMVKQCCNVCCVVFVTIKSMFYRSDSSLLVTGKTQSYRK